MIAQHPNLSLCMIVRDSATTLDACLHSIRPWVDEMIVVDTGSKDTTPEIARRYGASVFHFPWVDDFSAARNESLRLANGQWLFWMDADDTIDAQNGAKLRALARGAHPPGVLGYVVQVHCPDGKDDGSDDTTVVDHVKLVRNDPRIWFEGRIHEQVLPAIRRLGGEVQWTDLFVVHSGSDHSEEGKLRKRERDLRILQLDLAEHPDHPFVLFNLGMTYADIGEHVTAERWLRRCLEVSGDQESHVRKAYALLVSCLQQQRRLDEAQAVCMRGLALYPQDVELLFRQGMLAHEMGWLNEAVTAYRGALESREDRHFVSIDRCLAGHKTRNNLALVYADQGQHALAEVQWRSIVDIQPHFRPAWRGLGQTLVRQGKLTALELLVEELDKQADGRPDACWLRALAAEKKGDTDQMKSLLEEALKADPNHDSARHDYCRCLFLHGDLREAEAALEELTRRAPDDGAAFHNLGLVYARLEKRDQAIQAFERSLTVRPNSPVTRAELQRIGGVLGSQEPPAAAEGGIATPTLANDDRELPICHSRRALAQTLNAFRCAHPQVHARDNIVTERVCAMCRRWQEPPPPHFRDLQQPSSALRGLDCVFLGPETGVPRCSACRGEVNVKVFACRHPSRSETTLAECRTCADFSACPAADSSLARSEARARHRASHEATGNDRPLDIVYLFCHSPHQDLEILYSLRSVAQHLPYIRKVWIFGDRPNFLSNDTSIVEHVSHDVLAQPLGFHVPVRNDFLMLFLASLIPGLAFDFVKFSDDYIVLQDVPRDRLCTARALEDLNQLPLRGRGVYKDLIWLTYDILKRAGYPGYSFEAHVPQPYTRQVVLDAFQAFRDFVSEDRFAGLLSGTTICNFALKDRAMPFVWLEEEKSKAGFYKSCPPVEEIESACAEKLFLNFSDKMFTEPMVRFLQARFSQPCKYELPSQSPPLASVEETIHMNV